MPDGFLIGTFKIHFYGIIIMFGALVASLLATREAKWRGYDPEIIWDLFVWLIVAGVIGARVWHVLTPSPSSLVIDPVSGKLANPYFVGNSIHILDILDIRKGGLGIPGAVIGGAFAMFWYTRRNQLSFADFADIVAPCLALGQSIGRWGNFVNQELYGRPTNLPWKIFIDANHRLPGYQNVEYYHPLFLYESIWNLANMAFLLWLARHFSKKLKSGDLLLVYLIIYPVGRFLLEFLRLDSSLVAGINANQTFMVIVIFFSVLLLLIRHWPNHRSVADRDI